MKIIGISIGHSAAATYVENGKLMFAIEEEKMSRIKGHITFPNKSLSHIYKKFNLSASEIDFIAVGCEDISEFTGSYRRLNEYFNSNSPVDKIKGLLFDGLKRVFPYAFDLNSKIKNDFFIKMNKIGYANDKILLVNHHLAHAASAYYTSPWDESLIITSDGKGDGLCGASYYGKNEEISLIEEINENNSIGQFYQSVTKHLGYKTLRHEGKITGLAAYGNSNKTFSLMNEIFTYEKGNLTNNLSSNKDLTNNPIKFYKKYIKNNEMIPLSYVKSLNKRLGRYAIGYANYLNFLSKNLKSFNREDISSGIQKLTEESIVSFVEKNLKNNPNKNICLAGGVFANVRVNQKINEIKGVENVYVQPAMNDSGTALGAALFCWIKFSKIKSFQSLESVYIGPSYDSSEIEKCLKFSGLKYYKSKNFHDEIAKYLNQGLIIGRYNGSLEWGPRALGNRSILVRPTDKSVNDTLNKRLNRTEFMPFAPSVLDEDASNIFENYSDSDLAAKYMTITYNVKREYLTKIEAAVHIDGTARPQIVSYNDNPSYYKIIKSYKNISGIGVVMNTSFNMHEEPIVNTPNDALKAFNSGAVDILSIGEYIIKK